MTREEMIARMERDDALKSQSVTSKKSISPDIANQIKQTDWFREYIADYGEEPDLNTPDYDYQKAWQAGMRPDQRDSSDNKYHWPSWLPSGEMLKGPNHPTYNAGREQMIARLETDDAIRESMRGKSMGQGFVDAPPDREEMISQLEQDDALRSQFATSNLDPSAPAPISSTAAGVKPIRTIPQASIGRPPMPEPATTLEQGYDPTWENMLRRALGGLEQHLRPMAETLPHPGVTLPKRTMEPVPGEELARTKQSLLQNLSEGAIGFSPYLNPGGPALFASDIARNPGVIGDLLKMTGGAVARTATAPFSEKSREEIRQQPVETIAGLLALLGPALKVGSAARNIKKIATYEPPAEPIMKNFDFNRLMSIVEKRPEMPGDWVTQGQTKPLSKMIGDITGVEPKGGRIGDVISKAHVEGDGGSTINWRTGENMAGKPFYSVSIFPDRTRKIKRDRPTAEEIEQYIEDNQDVLSKHDEVTVGTWTDKKTGVTYLDLVVTLPKAEGRFAKHLGETNAQQAIYDLQDFNEVPTGGTGENPGGLPSIGKRLKDLRRGRAVFALEDAAEVARENIAKRISETKLFDLGGATLESFKNLTDLAIIGAARIARYGSDFASWSELMIKDYGDAIGPHLQKIYKLSARKLLNYNKKSGDKATLSAGRNPEELLKEYGWGGPWYEGFPEALDKVYEADARKMGGVYAATSQASEVMAGLTKGINIYGQHAEGAPINKVSRFGGVADENVKGILERGEMPTTQKLGPFYGNTSGTGDVPTIDRHISRWFGFGTSPTTAQVKYCQAVIRDMARDLGVTNKEMQAIIWMEQKLKNTPIEDMGKLDKKGIVPHFDQALYMKLEQKIAKGELPGKHPTPEMVRLFRYMKENKAKHQVLDPTNPAHRTGVIGEEFKRVGPDFEPRLHYYEEGVPPERHVLGPAGATEAYETIIPKERIYDIEADPKGLWKKALEQTGDTNKAESWLKKAGYAGYKSGDSGIVVMFESRPVRPVGGKSTPILTRMEKAESLARERLAKSGKSVTLGSGPFHELASSRDLIIIGASKIAHGAVRFEKWSAEIVAEFGDSIKPHLREMYQGSRKYLKEVMLEVGKDKTIVRPTTKPLTKTEPETAQVKEPQISPMDTKADKIAPVSEAKPLPEGKQVKEPSPTGTRLIEEAHSRYQSHMDDALIKARSWAQVVARSKGRELSADEISRVTLAGGGELPKDFAISGIQRYVSIAWPELLTHFKTKKAFLEAVKSATKDGSLEWSRRGKLSVPSSNLNKVFSGGSSSVGYDMFTRESFDRWASKQLSPEKESSPVVAPLKETPPTFNEPTMQKFANEKDFVDKPTETVEPVKPQDVSSHKVAPEPPVVEPPKPPVQEKLPIISDKEPIGLKNAETERLREAWGLGKRPKVEQEKWEASQKRAQEAGIPDKAIEIADEVIATKRPLGGDEYYGLVHKMLQLENEYDASWAKASELVEQGNTAASKLEMDRALYLEKQVDKIVNASEYAGTTQARDFNIRKVMLGNDYSFAKLVQKAQATKGRKLSLEEKSQYAKLAEDVKRARAAEAEAIKREGELQIKLERERAERILQKETRKAAISRKAAGSKEKILSEREDIKKQLRDIGMRVNDITGVTAEGSYLIGKLALNYAKEGAVSMNEVVRKVMVDIPDITESDVWQSILARDPKRAGKARSEASKQAALFRRQAKLLIELKDEKALSKSLLNELTDVAYKTAATDKRLENILRTINTLRDALKEESSSPKIQSRMTQIREKILLGRHIISTEKRQEGQLKSIQKKIARLEEELKTGKFTDNKRQIEEPIVPGLKEGRENLRILQRRKEIQKQIADLREQLRKGQIKPDFKTPEHLTPELAYDKLRLKIVRDNIAQLKRLMETKDKIADLENQLRTGEFKVKPKPEPKPISPELERAKIDLKIAQRRVHQALAAREPLNPIQEIITTSRTMLTISDISAVGRQGAVLITGYPSKAPKAFVQALQGMFSKYKFEQIDNGIRTRPTFHIWEKNGLDLPEITSAFGKREEFFTSNVLEKVPILKEIVGASNRHMVTFLNVMRVGAADNFLAKYPNATSAELRAVARWINVATGRGDWGAPAYGMLSKVFFAPRFTASRIQTPFMVFAKMNSPRTRKMIAWDMFKFASATAGLLTLAKLGGLDVGTNPRNADWGKIKDGKMTFDLFAGMQQPARVIVRIFVGLTDKAGISGKDYREIEREIDPVELMDMFSQYRLAPYIATGRELWTGKTMMGDKVTPGETAIRSVLPLVFHDMYEAYQEENKSLGKGALALGLSGLGVGVNTYDSKREIPYPGEPGRKEWLEKKLDEIEVRLNPFEKKTGDMKKNQLTPEERADFLKKKKEIEDILKRGGR